IGLLLPAVQWMREAGSRLQCRNNLKQIGLALYHYQGREKTFPPGYVSATDSAGIETGPGWGWGAFLLYDLEQGPLQGHINFTLDIRSPAHAARATFLPVFWCPSDHRVNVFTVFDSSGKPLADVAQSNYVAVNGTAGVSLHAADNNGAFLRNQRMKATDI